MLNYLDVLIYHFDFYILNLQQRPQTFLTDNCIGIIRLWRTADYLLSINSDKEANLSEATKPGLLYQNSSEMFVAPRRTCQLQNQLIKRYDNQKHEGSET